MAATALSALQVIGVRYRRTVPAVGDERALDAYMAAGVYGQAGVPAEVTEPVAAGKRPGEDEATAVGRFCGAIADLAAPARREGKAILMTGGDCTHSTGLLGGLQDAHGAAARIGLVWMDAHGDFNTPHTTLSGSLGGMPLAVCAGLAWPRWREYAHIAAPLPADRIVLVGARNLDPAEEQLIRATGTVMAAPAAGFPGEELGQSVAALATRCDLLYLHIDADILDRAYVPNHGTAESDGPSMEQVEAAVDTVMSTGKVAALAVVSVYGEGEGNEISVASGIRLIRAGLEAWRRCGIPSFAP